MTMFVVLSILQLFSFFQMMTMAKNRGRDFFSRLLFGLAGALLPVIAQVAYRIVGDSTQRQQQMAKDTRDRQIEMQRKISAFVSQTNNLLNQRAGINKYSMQKEYRDAVSVCTMNQEEIRFSRNRIELFCLEYDANKDRFFCTGDKSMPETYIAPRRLRHGIGYSDVMTLTNLVCLNPENERAASLEVRSGKEKRQSEPEQTENILFGEKTTGAVFEGAGMEIPQSPLKGVLWVKDTPEGFELRSGDTSLLSVTFSSDDRVSVDPSLGKESEDELAFHTSRGENLFRILSCRDKESVKTMVSEICLGKTNIAAAVKASKIRERSKETATINLKSKKGKNLKSSPSNKNRKSKAKHL